MMPCSRGFCPESQAAHLVKERFNRSQWVFIVYDLCRSQFVGHVLQLYLLRVSFFMCGIPLLFLSIFWGLEEEILSHSGVFVSHGFC